ncbi:MAG TPA: diaminopimelate decarboxylase [Alphaproteobacteria bacterium]|nr:diaminopimelate decarboxylase [Alphaproteobacteria bacterium]
MSDTFSYRNGILHAEDVSLEAIAKGVGTPTYVYSSAKLKQNYKEFSEPFKGLKTTIHYANKSNANQAVARTLIECGAGVDITSGGELERALDAGAAPDKIIFSGVGKTKDEIAAALKAGVRQLNVESIPELKQISAIASEIGKKAPVALRVNPNVAAHTHRKISTGEMGTKFGIDHAQLDEAMSLVKTLPNLEFRGFTVHIGSHLHNYDNFREAYGKFAEMVKHWQGKGYAFHGLDLGGGVGIPYDGQTQAPFSDYAAIVRDVFKDFSGELSFEPGRRLVGDAGILLTRVVYDKQGASKRFLIIDAGMNDLVRPAMYDARHSIIPVREPKSGDAKLADVVGPVCETSDLFGVDYSLPGVGQGDLVAILQAGAYSAAMSGNYNGRPLVPEVMVSGGQHAVVRKRVSVSEQMGWESLPPWMASAKTAKNA